MQYLIVFTGGEQWAFRAPELLALCDMLQLEIVFDRHAYIQVG